MLTMKNKLYTMITNINDPVLAYKQGIQQEIEKCVDEILAIRKNHNKTLNELYDPDTMPADLRAAHKKLDDEVFKLYKLEPVYEEGMFDSEMGILNFLNKIH